MLFFLLPLVCALFFGRTFCAAACPLGAVQDVFVLRPIRVPRPLAAALGLLPALYLGVALALAAAGAGFLICRYDPFVGFFRFGGPLSSMLTGGALLLVGTVVARPYCRFLCPYGVLLNGLSRFSRRHADITPTECVNCRLCEDACPFGCIRPPTPEKAPEPRAAGRRRLAVLLALLPLHAAASPSPPLPCRFRSSTRSCARRNSCSARTGAASAA